MNETPKTRRSPGNTLLAGVASCAALIVGGFLYPALAMCASATITWTNATKNDDGTTLTNLSGVKIYRALTSTFPAGTPLAAVAAPGTSYVDASSPSGTTVYYWATSFTPTAESVPTGPVSKVNPPALPNPPSGLTIAATTAYMEVREANKLVMLAVGTAAGGTQCDTSNAVISDGTVYYAIPVTSITWAGDVQPPVAFAKCS